MFKKFLHEETAIIGLKSLGLSAPKAVQTKQPTPTTTIREKQNQQAQNAFTSEVRSTIESSIHLNFTPQHKSLDELFGRDVKVRLNK